MSPTEAPDQLRRIPLAQPMPLHAGVHYMLGAMGDFPGARRVRDGALRSVRTPEGPATYAVRVRGGELEIQAWGAGATHVVDHLPDCLGVDDEPPPLPEPIGALQRKHPGVRRLRALDPFEFLMSQVIHQRVSGKEAGRSWSRLIARFGDPAPGPGGLKLPLSDAQWKSLGTLELAEAGIELGRARTLQELAKRMHRIRPWLGLPPREAAGRLRKLPGVGPWTVTMMQGWALGDTDAVILGDDGVPALVGWNLADERDATDTRMVELLEPYRPHRFRVIMLLEAADRWPPRRGHRIAAPRPGK